jgi:hypothetical protein
VPKFDFGDAIFVVLLLLSLFAGGDIGGGSPVFPTTKRAVAVIHESSERGKMTAGQLAVLGDTFRQTVEKSGVTLRIVDLDNSSATDEAWVAAALKVERKSVPWIVGSGPKSGFSAPLPATATSAEALKLIEGIK